MQTTTAYQNGVLTLRLAGELDHCAAATAMAAVELSVEEYMPRQCVLDLEALSFMDSSGIAVILKTERLLRQSGGAVSIVRPNAQTARVLELAGLGGMLQASARTKKECELI